MFIHQNRSLIAALTAAIALTALLASAAEEAPEHNKSLKALHAEAKELATKTGKLAANYADALTRLAESESDETMTEIGQEIIELEQVLRISQTEMATSMDAIARAAANSAEATAETVDYKTDKFAESMKRNGTEAADRLKIIRKQAVAGTALATNEALADAERKFAVFEQKLRAYGEAGADASEDLKSGLQNAWDELATATDKAQQEFESQQTKTQ